MVVVPAILALIAIALIVIGIRGRVVATGRFCRRCRFDLQGLDAQDPAARCPECGQAAGPTARARNTRRRRRPGAILTGVAMLLLSLAAGIAGYKQAAIYPKLSDGTLLLLERMGDDRAFDQLRVRLMSGQLPKPAIKQLAERYLERSEQAVLWSTDQSNIIAAGIAYDVFGDDQLIQIAERAYRPRLVARPEIHASDEAVWLLSTNVPNATIATFKHNAARFEQLGAVSPCRLVVTKDPIWILRPPHERLAGSHVWSNHMNWVPQLEQNEHPTRMAVPPDAGQTITLNQTFRYELFVRDRLLHTWEQSASTTVRRSDDPPPYSTPDDSILAPREVYHASPPDADGQTIAASIPSSFAQTLTVGYVQYPIKRDLARQHEGTKDFYWGRFIHLSGPHAEIGADAFLFDVSFAIDGQEIPLTSIHQLRSFSLDIEMSRQDERNMLDYYDRHAEFWAEAQRRGTVDVILRPNPALAVFDPRYTRHIGTGIIFRAVPLMVYQPTELPEGSRARSGAEWAWEQAHKQTYPSIRGEPLTEE